MDTRGPDARRLTLTQAADALHLPVESVEALVSAGYLTPVAEHEPVGPVGIALSDLKAFMARNAPADAEAEDLDADVLLASLDGRSADMAGRALAVFTGAFPEAADWPVERRQDFLEQARDRFEAILAVVGGGDDLDDGLIDDLESVGRSAASAGTPLPEVLLTLRISRDLVVQTAVQVASEPSRNAGGALGLVLTRVLPAMDRLTDAIARGYWQAVVDTEEAERSRYEAVVEHATDGVCEIDADGIVRYANPALAVTLGQQQDAAIGRPAGEVLTPTGPGPSIEEVLAEAPADAWTELRVRRSDGVARILQVLPHDRRLDDGRDGRSLVVRDVTADRDLTRQKDDFLTLMTQEIRTPLTTILGLGVTLDTYAAEMSAPRVRRMGRKIHRQADRLARLADDLFDVSRLETSTLMLAPRTVDLRGVAEAALGMLSATPGIDDVELRVPPGLLARADARRTEQVLAHLVENALVHGAAPVVVEGVDCDTEVELCVRDHGPGVPQATQEVMFERLHSSGAAPRYRDRASGLGLSLVRGLVEAMGGRVWYEPADDEGATFLVTLPTPRSMP